MGEAKGIGGPGAGQGSGALGPGAPDAGNSSRSTHGPGRGDSANTAQGPTPSQNDGPGNRGQGNAYGHYKHGRHGGVESVPARLQETQSQAQQFRSRIESTLTNTLGRADNNTRAGDTGRAVSQTRGDFDAGDREIRFRSYVGDGRSLINDGGAREFAHSASAYLRGLNDGSNLRPETRAFLDSAAETLGRDYVASLGDRPDGKVLRVVERALEQLGRTLERAHEGRGHVGDLRGYVSETYGRAASSSHQLARELLEELLGAAQLNRYLKHLEKTGGAVVERAEAVVARLLYGTPGGERATPGREPYASQPAGPYVSPHEILRDLRAGAFLPPRESQNPFPLTGRARVAAEMMELMRTLDAIEGALRQAAAQAGATQRATAEAALGAWLKAQLAGTTEGGAFDELLALLVPTLPGRAARYEIPRTVAALNGMLTDADGRALLAKDGTPLKLDRLLWLGAAGGLLGTSFLGSTFNSDTLPTRLSPLLLYGFDAVYAVIGFDGRTLAAPHYVAVQTAANDSEFEWVFGQQPFTPGWIRELIERLKDSALIEHNLFGETLEEAWADGRFHVALLSVAVEEGEAVADSAAVTRLLPGPSGALAFA